MRRAAIVLLLAAGCSSGSDKAELRTSDSPTAPTGSATAAPLSPGPTVTPPLGDEPVHFSTPTRNIGCYLSTGYARCDISQKSWTPPPKPAGCTGDWGNGLVLTRTGKAELTCASDTTLGGDVTVQYGGAVRVGDLQCVVSRQDVTCSSDPTGHSFRISRAAYTVS